MGGDPRRKVARTAGVDLAYVDRLVELQILRPDPDGTLSAGDALRVRWVHGLEGAGVPLEEMAAAIREGSLSFSFLDAPAFDRFTGVSDTTFGALSDRTGIPLELLKVIREAVGFAEPRPDDRMRDYELAVASTIELQLSNGFQPVVIERWLRVCADSFRRIAETETDMWHTQVELPLLATGMSESEMLESQADLGSTMAPLMEEAMLAIWHGQQEHAWSKNHVESVEAALEKAGLLERVHRPPAVSFLDLTGYTRLTEERGDEAAADLAEELAILVRRSSQGHGGQPVKWLGDGVMFFFQDPGQGVVSALEMVAGVTGRDLPPARVGMHAGPVVFQEGDYFGRTVNIASRIAEYARPGEVVVTEEVVEAAEGEPVMFTEIGPVELKGVSGSLRLHTARARSS
jgi:adenylate cyclase